MLFSKRQVPCVAYKFEPRVNLKDRIDKFVSSDFFKDDLGLELSSVEVFARSAANPELQNKMREFMIEQEVSGFDVSVSDDEVMKSLDNKYNSQTSILSSIKARIVELRQKNDKSA